MVDHLELDKVAQAMEITKLKRRVKKLEKGNKVKILKLRRLQKVGTRQRVETSDKTVMDDVSNQGRMIAKMDQDADVVLKDDKEAEIYKIDLDHANKVLSMQEDETEPAEVQEVVDVVTTVKLITKVVTAASETITAASTTITIAAAQVPVVTLTAAHAKDKVKGIFVEEPKPLKKQAQIEQDEKFARELEAKLNRNIDWKEAIDHVKKMAKEDPAVKKYQVLKREPQTESQARKNMIVYLKNVVGFKMDYFKGISYDDIHPIFEAKFNTNVAFLQKTREEIKEEESRALKMINKTPAERAVKRKKLDEEDLEALWSLVKERFSTSNPNNFSDDFLLVTLRAMFEKPDIHAEESKKCTWSSKVEREYSLTRFTLDQMLNAVRLEVEEESEFWSTAMAKTINREAQLHAKVDGKKIIVTESSVRRDLRLADEE
nr:hypothetical protein [Tanacetum cinerariifolium]